MSPLAAVLKQSPSGGPGEALQRQLVLQLEVAEGELLRLALRLPLGIRGIEDAWSRLQSQVGAELDVAALAKIAAEPGDAIQLLHAFKRAACPRSKREKLPRSLSDALGEVREGSEDLADELDVRLAGYRTAVSDLLHAHVRLAAAGGLKYGYRSVEFEFLLLQCAMGLERAVRRLEPERGLAFSTFAFHWVRQHAVRASTTFSRPLRVPESVLQSGRNLRRAEQEAWQLRGHQPSLERLVRASAEPPWPIERLERAYIHATERFDQAGSHCDVEDRLVDPTLPASAERLRMQSALASLETALEQLDCDASRRLKRATHGRLLAIARARFQLGEPKPVTLKALGTEFGVTRERVRQIEAGVRQRLRFVLASRSS